MRNFDFNCHTFLKEIAFILILLTIIVCFPQSSIHGSEEFTLKINTELVVTSVVVRDKDGHNIEGLTAKDFIITEDNGLQEISIFEFNKLENRPLAAASNQTSEMQLSPKPENSILSDVKISARYQNRRLLVMSFDMTAMQRFDQYRSFLAAKEFIQKHMTSSDLVSLIVYVNGSIKTLIDFTNDQNALLEIINKRINPGYEDELFNVGEFGQDTAEFNLFNTDRRLAGLQTAVNMLKTIKENKYLIYFTSGFRLNAMENKAQLRATINAAVRANVAFFPIDSRGLEAYAPLGDASVASSGGMGMYTGEAAMMRLTGFQQSHDTSYALAADTGGKAMLDNNDLAQGIVNAQQMTTSYYTIGYYPTNSALDGKFRRIKITLKEALNAKLEYRNGYYSGKTFEKFNEFDKERQLEEALMLEDPITEIPIAMEVNYFKLNSAEYFVPIHVKMPGNELLRAGNNGGEHAQMDFIGEIKDNYGVTIQNIRDKVELKLVKERRQELAKQPIQYNTGFTLLPGKYMIKFLARNAENGRIGTYQASFAIPNLMKPGKTIPISSVILSNQFTEIREALYNTSTGKNFQSQSRNPLLIQGQKLVPSATRVFSKSRNMFVYFEAYRQNEVQAQAFVAYVAFYRNQLKAFETAPIAAIDELDAKSRALPFRFSIPLSNIPSGEYSLQISVLDPNSQKVSFWLAPVMLIP